MLVASQLSSCSEHSCRYKVRSLESFGNESELRQMYNTSCSEDTDRSVTNDYDDFDISCRQFYFFSFPGLGSAVLSRWASLPVRSFYAAVFIKANICQQEDG